VCYLSKKDAVYMNNPHTEPKNYLHYSGEKFYNEHRWVDMDGLSLDVEGCYLIICTIQITTGYHANVGFRLVNGSNNPLMLRKSSNTRIPAHFSIEPDSQSAEDQTPVTFHVIAYCNVVKLQIRLADGAGQLKTNTGGTSSPSDVVYNHKPISTMSAIPLCPTYQPGTNKVFSYPKTRISPRGEPKPSKPNVS
jgi:hypothetical protein